MSRARRVVWVLAAGIVLGAGVAVALIACDSAIGDCGCGPCSDVVVRVIDGDTVELSSGERVRYLGVDTPESTGGKDECFGSEASQFNSDRVLDKRVLLEYDDQCRDQFQRLLAYIFVDDRMINLELVSQGYAQACIIAPNDRFEADIEAAETQAKNELRGVWGACPGTAFGASGCK